MTTSPSPTLPSPQFFQRKPVQVQAMQWPTSLEDPQAQDVIGVIFNWVGEAGGSIVWRVSPEGTVDPGTGRPEMHAAIIDEWDGDVIIELGDWVVRTPTAPDEPVRFVVETAISFDKDYQAQTRELRGQQKDFLQQIDQIAKQAEIQEAAMTPMERREANNVELERLGNVARGL